MTTQHRFVALDVLRGLIIALMILVNTPGSWSHVYSPLLHAAWDGFTFADIVFPGFLFIVGAAMAFSLKHASLNRAMLLKIGKRSLILFGCGLLLNWLGRWDLAELRIPGVLQRIALCYLLASLLILTLSHRGLWLAALGLLVGYFAILHLSDEPFSLQHNIVRTVDLALLGEQHLYHGFGLAFDPEGLLSCLPATVNVLLGFLVARGLQQQTASQGLRALLLLSGGLLLAALLLHFSWPVNKPLWSGSYALLSSGLLVLLLALLVYVLDVKQWLAWSEPLRIYGTNPLFIYMLSWVWTVCIDRLWLVGDGEQAQSIYALGYQALAQLFPAQFASLVFALIHVGLFWLVSWELYRRRIFIKI